MAERIKKYRITKSKDGMFSLVIEDKAGCECFIAPLSKAELKEFIQYLLQCLKAEQS